ncbi:MAG: hypothetical protein AUK37_07055 [Rhodobacterales bacterium CG2_30_65_12]|nr:MAG: hypothetical protein AUK37_07055 [Rhodobacterales bacterium CG2_30_65_12]
MFKALAATAMFAASLAAPASAQAVAPVGAEGVAPVGAEAVAPVGEEDDKPAPGLVITEAGEQALDDFLWLARVLVIFADSENDPRFVQQMENIMERSDELFTRDVVVITDTDPSVLSPIREALRPRGFALVLIGKDGQRYLRKPLPWDVREISRSIDKMPLRQQELQDSRTRQ